MTSDADYGAASIRDQLAYDMPDEEWQTQRRRYEQANPGRLARLGRLLREQRAADARLMVDAEDIV